jgi:hypothetical protein
MSVRIPMSIHTFGLFFLFTSLGAQAEQLEIEWQPDGRFGYASLLHGAAMTEICGPLDANAVVDWQVKSSTPIDFNVHYHQGEEVVYPTRQNGVSKFTDRLAVTAAETYCWMFTNPQSTPTVITLDLQLNPD